MKEIKKIGNEAGIMLDFIRGVSAQFVLIGHLLSFFLIQENYKLPVIQNFGVLVFFVLSGFLISQTSFLKGRDYPFSHYLIDRFSRIFFSFVPALVLVLVVDLWLAQRDSYNPMFNNSWKNFLGNLFMLQGYPMSNTVGIEAFGSARPFWTVSVEWWIYIFFGFIFLCTRKKNINLFSVMLFLVSIPVAFFYIHERGNGLIMVWGMGLVLAVLYNTVNTRLSDTAFWLIVLAAGIGIGYRTWYYREMYDLGTALFFGLLVFACLFPPNGLKKFITGKFFSGLSHFLASFSYSLYLIHYTLIELYLSFFKNPHWSHLVILFIVCNIIAYLFYLPFEKNHHRFKNILKKRLTRAQ